MVMPTTSRPWRTSSAATVELSTPPLIATAMGATSWLASGRSWLLAEPRASANVFSRSGMHGNPPQMRHGSFQSFHQSVHLFDGICAPQGESHAGARTVARQADRGEYVRRRQRAARASCARGNGEAPKIE